jgi:SAM-dependent methyltransferase
VNDGTPILNRSDAERVVLGYQRRIASHGPTLASLNSGDEEKQRLRHQVHTSALRGKCPTVLDVGCGLASFYEHLTRENRVCQYTGFDIVPEYVEWCRTRFAECRFELRNIFLEGIGGGFDSIVMSQAFNNRYEQSDNALVVQTALRLAYTCARVSVSIDMLSTYVDVRRPELFYYAPEEMFAFAKTLARRVVLRHDYRSAEFCLQLFREDIGGYLP